MTDPGSASLRVAYVMSRFPKLTETFVLNEILAVGRRGVVVDVYPLLRERATVWQPGARDVAAEAHYLPFMSRAILASQLYWLRRRPRAYLGAIATTIRECLGSARFLVGGLAILPKVAHAARLMARDRVDHVHCHFANHPALAGFVIGRLTGIPWSFTVHGSDLHLDKHMLCRKVVESAFVVPISEQNRAIIVETCGPASVSRMDVIHVGVDVAVFSAATRDDPPPSTPSAGPAADGSTSRPLRAVAVGTLHEVKGQRHLLEAAAVLERAGRPIDVELVGEGPDQAMLAALAARLGIAHRVTFAGACPRDEVVRRLRAADVLVAPSVPSSDGRREGIPVVLMEGMACGLPVVASRLSGIPELVRDGVNGCLVPPGDAERLADALGLLDADPELRARLGSAARATVEAEFNLERSADRLVERFAASRRAPDRAAGTS